ncbi:MAG: helix-turn-helix domain-containing protein, partial [Candidatus Methanomethylophilaceae archaeon]
LNRLGFIHLRYRGYPVQEASKIIGVSVQTGYNWQRSWNMDGMASVFPNYGGGRPRRMTPEQESEVVRRVSKGRMTTADVRRMMEEDMGLSYSEKQVHITLVRMGFRHERTGSRSMVWVLRGHSSKQLGKGTSGTVPVLYGPAWVEGCSVRTEEHGR